MLSSAPELEMVWRQLTIDRILACAVYNETLPTKPCVSEDYLVVKSTMLICHIKRKTIIDAHLATEYTLLTKTPYINERSS